MSYERPKGNDFRMQRIQNAASDQSPISGLTHLFYRYPARFSPVFARTCIEELSRPGDLVLDPYMGGGTTIVEAVAARRRAVGSDINSLSVFIASVKTTPLLKKERAAVKRWAQSAVLGIRCNRVLSRRPLEHDRLPRNLTTPSVRWLRKTIALCLQSIDTEIPSERGRAFARCVLLNVGQWALNGRQRIPTAEEFRRQVSLVSESMLSDIELFGSVQRDVGARLPILRQLDAEALRDDATLARLGPVDLVVTSPPYPSIHMLYHRWQVDGRKETDAPYWIASCDDGDGAAYYGFADRKPGAEGRYFEKAQRAFSAVHSVMRAGAVLAQLVAFREPSRQLRRYLRMMERAGFRELRTRNTRRGRRIVPGRRWHANSKGLLPSSTEIVLLHAKA